MFGVAKWTLGIALVVVVSVLLNGLLISVTWGWFIAPIFRTRDIDIPEGIGLSIFLSIILPLRSNPAAKDEFKADMEPWEIAARGLARVVGSGIFAPIFVLIMAWAWHTFVMTPNPS